MVPFGFLIGEIKKRNRVNFGVNRKPQKLNVEDE